MHYAVLGLVCNVSLPRACHRNDGFLFIMLLQTANSREQREKESPRTQCGTALYVVFCRAIAPDYLPAMLAS